MWSRVVAALWLLVVQATGAAGSLSGVVHEAGGAPVSGLVAVVFPSDQTAWPEAGARGLAKRAPVVAGRFEIADLPAGSYKLLLVSESALVDWPSPPTLGQLNALRAFPLALSGGPTGLDIEVSTAGPTPTMGRISVRTTRAVPFGADPFAPGRGSMPGPPRPTAPGAISGRVTGAEGHPLVGVEVRSVRRLTNNGASTLGNFGAAMTTDGDGRYRLTNRPPGSYLVVVVLHSVVRPIGALPAPATTSVTASGARLGLLATFYGDTSTESAATPVVVGTDERSGIDIRLTPVPLFTLTGSVPRDGASPGPGPEPMVARPGAELTVARVDGLGLPSPLDTQRVPLAADGTFRCDEVADGEYHVSFNGLGGWGEARMRVSGRDPDPLVVTIHPPMLVHGHAEFQGSTLPPTIGGPGLPFGVELAPVQLIVGSGFVRTPIQADGTFAARGSGAGPFRLRGTAPAPWFQVEGLVGGVDTMDLALPAGPDASDAVLVFADRPAGLRVTVVDGQSQPVGNAGVLIFHADPRYWTAMSRRVQFGATLSNGSCGFTGLPPGRYFAVLTPGPGAPMDGPALLIEHLRADATPFEIVAGQDASIRLSVKR